MIDIKEIDGEAASFEIDAEEHELDAIMLAAVRLLNKNLDELEPGTFQDELKFFTHELRQYLIEYFAQIALTEALQELKEDAEKEKEEA